MDHATLVQPSIINLFYPDLVAGKNKMSTFHRKLLIMPVSYMVYGSFTLLAIALLIYLFSLRKRR